MSKGDNRPDIKRVIELHDFLLKFQAIDRRIHLKKDGKQQRENDVEHSYFLAMMTWFLAEYFPELDKNRAIQFAMVHDLVEIYAGDTYIFADKKQLESKKQREHDAFRRIEKEWLDFSDMSRTIAEYEKLDSEEAKFVYSLDKLMPVIMNVLNDGHTWKQEKITLQQLHEQKKTKAKYSTKIEPYYQQLYELMLENQHLFGDKLSDKS